MSESEMTADIAFFSRSEANHVPPKRVKADAALVGRARAGEAGAFDEIYKSFAPLVHGIILARVRRDEVDDIVQDVFLSAYKNLHALRDENAIGAWLAMIARNHATEFYRRAKFTEELPDDLARSDRPRTEAKEVLSAIRALPESYSETLVLRLVEGMTGTEIADRTGLTPESVRVNLHRGMKMLRQRLGIVGDTK
jgi:RNA polymerase sigma-70 factor (ECF subfamily)